VSHGKKFLLWRPWGSSKQEVTWKNYSTKKEVRKGSVKCRFREQRENLLPPDGSED
jgi:hypothetical protein